MRVLLLLWLLLSLPLLLLTGSVLLLLLPLRLSIVSAGVSQVKPKSRVCSQQQQHKLSLNPRRLKREQQQTGGPYEGWREVYAR